MTMGTMATTRLSTAPVSQVVQPRLDPPATTKDFTSTLPPLSLASRAVTVSIARTALFTMGSRGIHVGSPVSMNLTQPSASKSSSDRGLPSSLRTSGWFGTIFSSATTEFVALAMVMLCGLAAAGAGLPLRPPPMLRNAAGCLTSSGLTTTSQCCQTARSTSGTLRHDCDFRSTTKVVTPSPGMVFTTFHSYVGSAFATYSSSAVFGPLSGSCPGAYAVMNTTTDQAIASRLIRQLGFMERPRLDENS